MNSGERIVNDLSARVPAASVIANSDRSVVLVRSFFAATEGLVEPGSHLKLGLCMAGGGRLSYGSGGRSRDLQWRPGSLCLTVPQDDGEFASPEVDMIGVAVDLEGRGLTARRDFAAPPILRDEVIRSVLVALWTSAEFHGPASAFIDHGVDIILERALRPDGPVSRGDSAGSLSRRQLELVREYLESRIAGDIRVPELSALVGMEARRFSRALRATTGLAPYAYLTARRMERARALLDAGESVTGTALSVGYTNPGKFAAAFRRLVGCAPSEWKGRKA